MINNKNKQLSNQNVISPNFILQYLSISALSSILLFGQKPKKLSLITTSLFGKESRTLIRAVFRINVPRIASSNKNIIHLSIRGTLIRKTALISVRDSFPNSDVVINDNFFGFWPKSRIEDKALIDKYCKMKLGEITF